MDKRIYIIGAGFAGQTIADDIKRKKIFGKVNAFLDDDKKIIGTTIDGVPVLGPISSVTSILSNSDLDEAIIAIPSAPTERIREIYETLTKNGFNHITISPGISQPSPERKVRFMISSVSAASCSKGVEGTKSG